MGWRVSVPAVNSLGRVNRRADWVRSWWGWAWGWRWTWWNRRAGGGCKQLGEVWCSQASGSVPTWCALVTIRCWLAGSGNGIASHNNIVERGGVLVDERVQEAQCLHALGCSSFVQQRDNGRKHRSGSRGSANRFGSTGRRHKDLVSLTKARDIRGGTTGWSVVAGWRELRCTGQVSRDDRLLPGGVGSVNH